VRDPPVFKLRSIANPLPADDAIDEFPNESRNTLEVFERGVKTTDRLGYKSELLVFVSKNRLPSTAI